MKRTPLTPSLSPSGGEGVRRTGEGEPRRFMVPMYAEDRKRLHQELWEPSPGFGLRQSSGALAVEGSQPKAPEDWRSPRRYRAIHNSAILFDSPSQRGLPEYFGPVSSKLAPGKIVGRSSPKRFQISWSDRFH